MADAALPLLDDLADTTFQAPVEELRVMAGLREHGLDEDHVHQLVETVGQWPAIVVWHANNLVIDGAHRLAAAELLGNDTIPATSFVGNVDEAFAEAVRRNVTHGLPLTLKDRTAAANRMLRSCPEWSDRRIGEACGLSPKTVARLRKEASSEGEIVTSESRVGRDGRSRPVEPVTMRRRIAEVIAEHPGSSLRAIAATVGASPETVRSVRTRLKGDSHTREERAPHVPPSLTLLPPPRERRDWRQDRALASCASSATFLKWFERTQVDDEWTDHVVEVPLSRVYEIADEARRRANIWREFAEAVEARARRARP